MADLADANHFFGQDIAVSSTGDIALATKSQRTIQRIIRRMMTVPTGPKGSAYPWEPAYGIGLGRRIGQTLDVRGIAADFRSQMLLEATVAKSPPPVVTVAEIPTGANITVNYTDDSGIPQSFSFDLSP